MGRRRSRFIVGSGVSFPSGLAPQWTCKAEENPDSFRAFMAESESLVRDVTKRSEVQKGGYVPLAGRLELEDQQPANRSELVDPSRVRSKCLSPFLHVETKRHELVVCSAKR